MNQAPSGTSVNAVQRHAGRVAVEDAAGRGLRRSRRFATSATASMAPSQVELSSSRRTAAGTRCRPWRRRSVERRVSLTASKLLLT